MKVTLEFSQPDWRTRYTHEQHLLAEALSPFHPHIDHIGSTSLQDMWAKPIIDILVGLPQESCLDQVIEPMISAGFTYVPKFEDQMPYRRFFVRLHSQTSPRSVIDHRVTERFGVELHTLTHIHVVVKDTPHWQRHVAFREYLAHHPPVREAYCALKQAIARRDLADALAYNAHKADFIREVENEAVKWFADKNSHQS